MSFVRLSHHNR